MNRPARVLAALALACVLAGALLSTRPSWAGWRDILKKVPSHLGKGRVLKKRFLNGVSF